MWDQLFAVQEINPENTKMVIKRAIEINLTLLELDYLITGASGRFTDKGRWQTKPKITITDHDGKKNIPLPEPTNPTIAKALVAILYCLCSINSATGSAHLFFTDKNQDVSSSIASKHGPQKSNYMKSLIIDLNDEELISRLSEEFETSLPEGLSDIKRELIEGLRDRLVSEALATLLMDKYGKTPTELEFEVNEITRIKGLQERYVPLDIMWGNISTLEHSKSLEKAVKDSLYAAEAEIDELDKELGEAIKYQTELAEELERVMRRNLLARILNKPRN